MRVIVEETMAEKEQVILVETNMHNPVNSWKNDGIELSLNGIYEKVQ